MQNNISIWRAKIIRQRVHKFISRLNNGPLHFPLIKLMLRPGMKAKANTTSEESNEKSMEVGDPRMAEMEE